MSGEGRDTLEHREELLLRETLDAEALRVLVGRGALDGPPVGQGVAEDHVGHALVDGLRDGAAGGRDARRRPRPRLREDAQQKDPFARYRLARGRRRRRLRPRRERARVGPERTGIGPELARRRPPRGRSRRRRNSRRRRESLRRARRRRRVRIRTRTIRASASPCAPRSCARNTYSSGTRTGR